MVLSHSVHINIIDLVVRQKQRAFTQHCCTEIVLAKLSQHLKFLNS